MIKRYLAAANEYEKSLKINYPNGQYYRAVQQKNHSPERLKLITPPLGVGMSRLRKP